jgi:hypothetical protein
MTTNTDIVNRALQVIGTRTTVTDTELLNQTTNESIQAALVLTQYRDQLLRMAPWDCCLNYTNLVYITSVPGTPENTSPATLLWQKGQPAPPYSYEYQYPVDCLRACFVIPANQTGQAGGIPITTAVTGGAPAFWSGQPIKFKVAIDQFYPALTGTVVAGGTGYAVGDLITLVAGPNTSPPVGAPVILLVATLGGGGAVATVTVVNQIIGSATPLGGSYFAKQAGTIAQGSTTGAGLGATFTLTFGAQGDQRVVLTNQEFATMAFCRQVVDPNVMDPMFQEAWVNVLGAKLCMALTGDKGLANGAIGEANRLIMEARKVDGNEGLTINDVTPDFIRIRGIAWTEAYSGPWSGFDWGSLWATF